MCLVDQALRHVHMRDWDLESHLSRLMLACEWQSRDWSTEILAKMFLIGRQAILEIKGWLCLSVVPAPNTYVEGLTTSRCHSSSNRICPLFSKSLSFLFLCLFLGSAGVWTQGQSPPASRTWYFDNTFAFHSLTLKYHYSVWWHTFDRSFKKVSSH